MKITTTNITFITYYIINYQSLTKTKQEVQLPLQAIGPCLSKEKYCIHMFYPKQITADFVIATVWISTLSLLIVLKLIV